MRSFVVLDFGALFVYAYYLVVSHQIYREQWVPVCVKCAWSSRDHLQKLRGVVCRWSFGWWEKRVVVCRAWFRSPNTVCVCLWSDWNQWVYFLCREMCFFVLVVEPSWSSFGCGGFWLRVSLLMMSVCVLYSVRCIMIGRYMYSVLSSHIFVFYSVWHVYSFEWTIPWSFSDCFDGCNGFKGMLHCVCCTGIHGIFFVQNNGVTFWSSNFTFSWYSVCRIIHGIVWQSNGPLLLQ